MGLLSRVLIPRGVRRAIHPVRTAKRAATRKSVKKLRHSLHPVDNAVYGFERSLNTKKRSPRSRAPVWHHPGCTINHRSEAAANRCSVGRPKEHTGRSSKAGLETTNRLATSASAPVRTSIGGTRLREQPRAEELDLTKSTVDQYFAVLRLPEELHRSGRLREGLDAALENLQRVPAFVDREVAEYGRFQIDSIPPIDSGNYLAAVLGDSDALTKIEKVVASRTELEHWRESCDVAQHDLKTVVALREHVDAHPGCVQPEMGSLLGTSSDKIRSFAYDLSRIGVLRREKSGRSYALFAGRTSTL